MNAPHDPAAHPQQPEFPISTFPYPQHYMPTAGSVQAQIAKDSFGWQRGSSGPFSRENPSGKMAIRSRMVSGERGHMSELVYVSKVRIERKSGPLRIAYLPGESQPVYFSVHGAIAEHYKVDPAKIKESHASTLDYTIAATAG